MVFIEGRSSSGEVGRPAEGVSRPMVLVGRPCALVGRPPLRGEAAKEEMRAFTLVGRRGVLVGRPHHEVGRPIEMVGRPLECSSLPLVMSASEHRGRAVSRPVLNQRNRSIIYVPRTSLTYIMTIVTSQNVQKIK